MPMFGTDGNYRNVNEIADAQGLIWDGHFGSPYGIPQLVDASIDYEKVAEPWERLFDHTVRLKPRGSGNKRAVLAISSPYSANDDALSVAAHDCARALGLEARVGDERDRVYAVEGTTPILFWRSDLHDLK